MPAWTGNSAKTYSHAQYLSIVIVSAGIYLGLAKLGLDFTAEGSDTAFIWPPSGYATALLFLLGLRFLPVVLLGSLVANMLFSKLSTAGAVAVTAVDTTEALIAVGTLRWLNFHSSMARIRDAIVFLFATGIVSTMSASTLGTLLFSAEGQMPWSTFWKHWLVYWIANATANLSLAPVLLTWSSTPGVLAGQFLQRTYLLFEASAIAVLTIITAYIAWVATQSDHFQHELEYMLFPILMWAGLRFGPRATSMVIAVTTIIAVFIITLKPAIQLDPSIHQQLFAVQMFLGVFATTGHVLGGVAEERAQTQKQLSQARDTLEVTVAERTEDIVQTKSFLEAVLENVSAAIIAVDAKGSITQTNRAARQFYKDLANYKGFGTWARDFQLYRYDGSVLPENEIPLVRALNGEVVHKAELATKPDGDTMYYLLASCEPIRYKDGIVAGAVVVAHDITDQKKAENLQRLFNRATVTANEAPDTEQAVLSIMEIVCSYTGWPIGHALSIRISKGSRKAVSTDWWFIASDQNLPTIKHATSQVFGEDDDLPGKVLSTGRAQWFEVARESTVHRLRKLGLPTVATGLAFPVMADSKMVAILEFFTFKRSEPDAQLLDTMKFVCAQLGRVYERELSTQRLMNMTLRDPLTEMPNRLAFQDFLRQAIAHARRRENYSFAVLFLDLDRFKIINDSLGHAAGDSVIVESARRVASCLRDGDVMARLGGDEFTVLLDDLGQRSDGANALKVAQRIVEEIARPIKIKEETVHVSVSIGVVLSAPHYTDPEMLLRDADAAMYRAKASGRSRVELFSPQLHNQVMSQLRLESDLRKALERNEFRLYYQPIVHLNSGEVAGFEALVRWEHPERGLVSPAQFIPMCEETGLIVPLGTWIIKEACQWISKINYDVPELINPLTVSVNVSGVQLTRGAVVGPVQVALSNGLLRPQQLHLEIVESTLVENPVQAVHAIESLRKMGVKIMIDDFGTGYSSLSYLSRLPLDYLKIDRSFVSDMKRNENSAEVVRCIISMADALKLSVVGEGIETRDQSDALLQMGCKLGQGYFYSKPLAGDTAAELAVTSIMNRQRNN